MAEQDKLRELVANVAAAYFANAHVTPAEIPIVVENIAKSLLAVGHNAGSAAEALAETPKATSAQVRKSLQHDHLISFEDGKPYKSLKRHLAKGGLTPEGYREKWGLPKDYPMVSAAYSAQRSAMARSFGLGQKGGKRGPAKRKKATAASG